MRFCTINALQSNARPLPSDSKKQFHQGNFLWMHFYWNVSSMVEALRYILLQFCATYR